MPNNLLVNDVVNICSTILRTYGVPQSTGDTRPGMFVALPELYITGAVYKKLKQMKVPVSPETQVSYLMEQLGADPGSRSRERVDLTVWSSNASKPVSIFEFLWEWSGKKKIGKDLARCQRLASAPGARNLHAYLVSIGLGSDEDKVSSVGRLQHVYSELAAEAHARAPIIARGRDSGMRAELTVRAYLVNEGSSSR